MATTFLAPYAMFTPPSAGFILNIIPLLCLLAVIILPIMLVIALMKRSGHQEHGASGEEAELMQELYQGLSRLEARVESLETILLSKTPRGEDR